MLRLWEEVRVRVREAGRQAGREAGRGVERLSEEGIEGEGLNGSAI